MGSSSDLLAVIAGSSQMPLVVVREARQAGRRVVAAAIRGITSPALEETVERVDWLEWGDLPAFLAVLESWRQMGVREAVMVGKVEQQRIYDRHGDEALTDAIDGLPTGHTDELLGAVAKVLTGAGIELLDSTRYLQSMLASPGRVAGREPSAQEAADMEHGWAVAKELGRLDIGQTVVIKERAVVAVEAMEGTDATIRRAGELAGSGCVVVKVAKPSQDLRFDVPVIGADTLRAMAASGASALAVEAGLTVVFDEEAIEALATAHGMAVWARARD